MSVLLPLSSVTANDVENLLDDAFGLDRHQRTAYMLRQGMAVINHLSFAILDESVVVGSIQCWPVAVGNASLILVGPVAVASAKQNGGLGHRLMTTMLEAATPHDPPMVMIGDPEYYGRFGFFAEGTDSWTLPGPWEPHRLLLRNPLGVVLPETGMLGPRL
jgi:predicted N-acetyltransferase YhbS